MKFTWGYEMESMPGRVIAPPLLHDKISLTSSGNTARWIFYGTRKEILDWMREHPKMVIEYQPYAAGLQVSSTQAHHTELIFDLLAIPDEDQSYYQYFKSFVVSDYEHERIKCEIRPKLESKDSMIETLCRVITRNPVCLSDIVDELEHQWNQPARSYYQQVLDVYNEQPAPSHVISSAGPSSIRVGDDPSVQVQRPAQSSPSPSSSPSPTVV